MFFIYHIWFILNFFLKSIFQFFSKFYNYAVNFLLNTPFKTTYLNYFWVKFLRYLLNLFFNWDVNKSNFIHFLKNVFEYKFDLRGEERFFFYLTYKNNTLFTFKSLSNKSNFSFLSLKLLTKQYNFFKVLKIHNYLNKFYCNFNLKNNYFLNYLILQKLFYTNFFNISNFYFFYKFSNLNLIVLNWFFFVILRNSHFFCSIYNVSYYDDWYKVNFQFLSKIKNLKLFLPIKLIKLNKKFKVRKLLYFKKIYKFYNKKYKFFIYKFYNKKYINIFFVKLNNLYNFKFKKINLPIFINNFKIRYSDSSLNKYISLKNLNGFNFFFLRKNRIFNKSRYSRNRQLYRTGVYWCLWLNIIIVYGLFFLFYRFTFNFGYIWFGLYLFFGSFLISKVIKYNFTNIFVIFKEIILLLKWFGFLINNLLSALKHIFKGFFINSSVLSNINYWMLENKFVTTFYINFFNYGFLKNMVLFFKKLELVQFSILWQEMKEKDTSFLRYRTIIFFLKQLTQINKMV